MKRLIFIYLVILISSCNAQKNNNVVVLDLIRDDFDTNITYVSYEIQFDLKNKILNESMSKVKSLASYLVKHPNLEFFLEVHFDERYDNNLGLDISSLHAKELERALHSYGVKNKIHSIGEGSKEALIKNASSEHEHSKNRRVEFYFKSSN